MENLKNANEKVSLSLEQIAEYLSKIPKIEKLIIELFESYEKTIQKRPYLQSKEACKYLQCSNTTLQRLVKSMTVERTDKGYNSYDLQQVYNRNLNYRYFNRPSDWEDKLKPIY
ncbi:MAG: hypothetical protein MUC49_15120 [Raineya sp.]|jgi:hypothetical protein|nr:hypothetical protein [Raineya sp.]